MKFGIILPNYGSGSTADEIRATALLGERSGFDSVWTTDHILLPQDEAARFGILFEALTTLCYLAGVTTRIRLGISSLVLPLRNPLLVAKQVATLDALSGGRALLCVGSGWARGEFANLGQSFSNRGRRLDEGIHILRMLWDSSADEPMDYNGRYVEFQRAVFSPKPVQPGGPPIWVGGHSDAARRRAAELGDGWHPSGLSFERFQEYAPEFVELAKRREFTLSARVRLSYDPSNENAQVRGTDAEISATLEQFRLAGLEYPVITFSGSSATERLDAIEHFAEAVLPSFIEQE